MTENFKEYSKYYNLLYSDKDYASESNYVMKLIKVFMPNAKSILEFGSGAGGHGLFLQKKGFKVFGLDRSKYMVAEAKRRGLPCCTAEISKFELKEKFDAVISLFHVVSYLTGNEELISTFFNAKRQLKKDGVFLFDVWYSPAVYEQKATAKIKKIRNKEIEIVRKARPVVDNKNNIINIKYSVTVKNLVDGKINKFIENHPMRHFSIPEIGLLARQTGFEVIRAEEFLTGNTPSIKTWGVCFILKKL